MRLTKNDLIILYILDKFRVVEIKSLFLLSKSTHIKYLGQRLKTLRDRDLVQVYNESPFDTYKYTLTAKGYKAIEKAPRVYTIHPGTLRHELLVAFVAGYLIQKHQLSYEDIKTDREFKKEGYDGKHKPDLYIEKINLIVEVELSQKTIKKVENNMMTNETLLDKQLWVIEGRRQKLIRHLNTFIDQMMIEAEIMTTDEMMERCKKLYE